MASSALTTRPLRVGYLFQGIGMDFTESAAVQLHIYHQIRALQDAGHNAFLVALQGRQVLLTRNLEAVRSGEEGEKDFAFLNVSGKRPYMLLESGLRRIQSRLGLPYLALFDSHRMFEACTKNRDGFDIIHERYNLMAVAGALASRRLTTPYVLEVNADMLAEQNSTGRAQSKLSRAFATWATRYCFKTAECLIAVSTSLRDHLVRAWQVDERKIVVLPNAADTSVFSKSYSIELIRREFNLQGGPVIIFVGGFYPWHDLLLLLESFAGLLHQVPDARLMLVGDGRTRAEIERKLSEMQLNDRVILTGRVAHERIPELLAIADVAVAPFIPFFDGMGGSPLKVFEYMAAGKAIVATKTGQITDIITDERSGLLVSPGDAKSFERAMCRLLVDATERSRIGQNAQREALQKHSWAHYARQLEEIYWSILT